MHKKSLEENTHNIIKVIISECWDNGLYLFSFCLHVFLIFLKWRPITYVIKKGHFKHFKD